MPYLSKEAISKYIRTECKRQLRLYLTPDNKTYQPERTAQQMPPPQDPRPGLAHIKEEGESWQAKKLYDLTQTFGSGAVIGKVYQHSSGETRYRNQPLQTALLNAAPYKFLVEAEFTIGPTFEQSMSIDGYRSKYTLDYAAVRPDILEILPALSFPRYVLSSGEVKPLPPNDTRLQLRVIDIKLTAEPSPSYFAEITYYTMALTGWLIDNQLDHQFVVIPDGAIWPGSHDASHLTILARGLTDQGITPSTLPSQLLNALEKDLEQVPYEVFSFRLRRFLQEELPQVLDSPSWKTLAWHVDTKCQGCEYLGYPWANSQGQLTNHLDHCIPTAEQQGHLSRVAFISRGASIVLQSEGVTNVASLAQRSPADSVYNKHQVLRATRTVISGRASSLQTQQASIPPSSGSSAVMPKWADLHIYLSADFDLGSAITSVFGLQAFWLKPLPYGSPLPSNREKQIWGQKSFIVDQKDLLAEQRELLAFLAQINTILAEARTKDEKTTVQFYLWDSLQYDHLTRVIGRHLPAILNNQTIQHLAWLFPSEELLPNYALATRESPITIVREVVRALLAAPIPHYYSLLGVARIYHDPGLPASLATFSVHPLFEDELSDQIPSERAHEIWSRSTAPHWQQQMRILDETVRKKLTALETVTKRLENDLKATLAQTAPKIKIEPPQRQNRLSADSQLWYAFAKLDTALTKLETQQIRAMPPHEREARFHSARLTRRLTGIDEAQILASFGLQPVKGRRVYEMRIESREVKMREGDFSVALAPEAHAGFLDRLLQMVTQNTPLEPNPQDWQTRMEDVTGVTIVALDREQRLIVLDSNRRWPDMLDKLETNGIVDFSQEVILDPVHHDYFTKKLLAALVAIGNPPAARTHPWISQVQQATGQMRGRGARQTQQTPPADLLWEGQAMSVATIVRNLAGTRAILEQNGIYLNTSQWRAWDEALSKRLQLVWGPPGTGKSRTAKAIIAGAMVDTYQQQKNIRVLICASTYTAIDIVLLDLYKKLQQLLPTTAFECYRLRSYLQLRSNAVPPSIDLELNKHNPSAQVLYLRSQLTQSKGIFVIGATPEQVHNLLVADNHPAQDELFDLILIDEASQMDVAHAILALCALAEGGSVVLAGDPKQLPPIHQAEAPVGLEHMVGPIYTFCEKVHEVKPQMLDENYRSNATLVGFSLNAGYGTSLSSYSPDLRLHLLSLPSAAQPPNWPGSLYWIPEWASLLDPNYPATCFVYPEGRSSQWNQFEADAVAALLYLLFDQVTDQLLNERYSATGQIIPTTLRAYTPNDFWQKAVGVVTPHRAQQGLIVSRLQQIFANAGITPSLIRDAVDTVERFQGQQRDVIIASFALGDPDAIQNEDEFLMSLNRFNVMASRARAKLVVFVSREIVDHLSSDLDTLHGSRLLKFYVDSFCQNAGSMDLGFLDNGVIQLIRGTYKRNK